MDARLPALADQLLLIEGELRKQGWWRDTRPSAEALASVEPFSVDTLDFDQWLQWVFLPRMKLILENDLPLPNASGILEMAEMVYIEQPEQSRGLREALARFDQLITGAA